MLTQEFSETFTFGAAVERCLSPRQRHGATYCFYELPEIAFRPRVVAVRHGEFSSIDRLIGLRAGDIVSWHMVQLFLPLLWIAAAAIAIFLPFAAVLHRERGVHNRSRLAVGASRCGALTSLKLSDTAVVQTSVVPAGGFAPPDGRGNASFAETPSFCRVTMALTPTADSNIAVEVWLPLSGWNGKYQAVGNGGWAGAIGYPALAAALKRGYAASATDTGHTGNSASFALGHPEKLIDYAYRSEHAMAVAAKAVVQTYYGEEPRLLVLQWMFNGRPPGARRSPRYPDDFDGIIAGAAANPKTHLDAGRMVMSLAMFKSAESFIPASGTRRSARPCSTRAMRSTASATG